MKTYTYSGAKVTELPDHTLVEFEDLGHTLVFACPQDARMWLYDGFLADSKLVQEEYWVSSS